jgi:NCS1 family nucleobase:cation symporter-1
MRAADLAPVPGSEQTQRPLDLFLIFAGANVVATTLQAGASLPAALGPWGATAVIGSGAFVGAGLVGLLAPIGSRLRVPSIVASRAVLGYSGAQALALLLFVTNFAWIALNNAIAASITAAYVGVGDPRLWAVALGLLATLVVWGGPRLAALVDRVAVPLLLVSGGVFTWACLQAPWPAWPAAAVTTTDLARAVDVVVGYQSTWLLMFADYPRYVRTPRAAGWAVFWGLALTAGWFMPLGFVASAIAGSPDPGAMVRAVGIGGWGALLISVATLTTNFVNIYMSALALKSLRQATGDTAAVWLIGGIGAAIGLLSTALIERFAGFTLLLAGLLVPIGGILLAHFSLLRRPVAVEALYVRPASPWAAWSPAGTTAWLAGLAVFHLAQPVGGTVPCLATAIVVYAALASRPSTAAARRA